MQATERKQEIRFLMITFALVVMTAGASFVSIMTVPVQATRAAETVRNPASLPPVTDTQEKPSTNWSKLEALQWDCKSKSQTTTISATHLRLKGQPFCRGQKLPDMKIVNKTNGFTASVFVNEKGFLTDFINLKPGHNEILIEWTDAKGKTGQSELVIERK